MKVWMPAIVLGLVFIQTGAGKQALSTCSALEEVLENRADRAGETCNVHSDCDSFNCVGVVKETHVPPVIANTTYTFFPCDDPPTFSVFAVVNTLDEPVLDEVLEFNGTVTIEFNPSDLGTIDITLIPTESGVIFGANVYEPSKTPQNYELFPETEVPLECVDESGDITTQQSLSVLAAAALVALMGTCDYSL